ncbi:MAG TPA: methyltransferase domain-containing protein [Opitutus sp.]|nr:methyltransferase domain-containing protein [Opitutus sp.]
MAAVEDEMWFYRALHAHLERELAAGLQGAGGKRSFNDPATQENSVDASFAILDAGCGTGGLIRRLEQRRASWQWTGIDLEPLACELARTRCAAEILQGSLGALPFEDNTFDAVVCSDVLYHLDDDVAALRELFRVLRPGGVAVINVPAHRWLWSYHDVTVHGRRRYDRVELREKLLATGFTSERLTHWNALPLPLVVIRRKLLPAPPSGSDVRLYPRPVEAMFRLGTKLEAWWLNSVGSLALGSSLLVTGRKPK